MRRMTLIVLSVVAVLLSIATIAQVSTASSPAQASLPGTHYETFTGRDFDPIQSDSVMRFAAGTGGGVWMKSFPAGGIAYIEARAELPDGATVTAVTFYARSCESDPLVASGLYFGAYTPSSGAFTYYIPETPVSTGGCAETLSIPLAVSPTVTVDNSLNRYVIGYRARVIYDINTYDISFVKQLLVGAQLTYQMPGAFLPLVRK